MCLLVRGAREELPLLEPLGPHEARHTFASILIAADVNVKAISSYMGHASIAITLDRYGHLMVDHAATAVARVDEYLAAAQTAAQGGSPAWLSRMRSVSKTVRGR